MNKPVSTIVVAVDVPAAPAVPGGELKASFDRLLLSPCSGLGFVTQETGGLNLALTLTPDAAPDSPLRRVAAACGEFDAQAGGAKARALFHYGTVFRSEGTGGRVTYLGSAIRAAQTQLHRIAAHGGLYVSLDFADYASTAPGGFGLDIAAGTGEARPVRLVERRRPEGGEISGSDPQFLATLKKRLAHDVGPFAGPLVDNSSRAGMGARDLINALSHEIEKPAARQAFENEMLAYVASRTRP